MEYTVASLYQAPAPQAALSNGDVPYVRPSVAIVDALLAFDRGSHC